MYSRCSKAIDSVGNIEQCVAELREWMMINKLALNDKKTEIVHFHSKFPRKIEFERVTELNVGESPITTCNKVRNLGFHFDEFLSLNDHISSICKSVLYSLFKIGRIRKFLDRKNTETLVHALITSRLDFCNSLLHNLKPINTTLDKLQFLQNSAARLVTRTGLYEHITPILRELHWLPICQRTKFKILLITYKCLNGQAPIYLSELLVKWSPRRQTRQAITQNELRLEHSIYDGCDFYGSRAFSVAAPILWNALPINIRNCVTVESFKSNLKTHLFKEYYDS